MRAHRVRARSRLAPPSGHWAVGSDPTVFRSDFSHPISHRTPHYRVGNGGIRWMAISQKRLNFGMKRNCKIQGKMGCNGLGNRCPSRKNANLNFEISRRRRAKVTSLALAMTTDPKRRDRYRVFRISQTHAVCRRDSGTRRSRAVGLHTILLGHPLGHDPAAF